MIATTPHGPPNSYLAPSSSSVVHTGAHRSYSYSLKVRVEELVGLLALFSGSSRLSVAVRSVAKAVRRRSRGGGHVERVGRGARVGKRPSGSVYTPVVRRGRLFRRSVYTWLPREQSFPRRGRSLTVVCFFALSATTTASRPASAHRSRAYTHLFTLYPRHRSSSFALEPDIICTTAYNHKNSFVFIWHPPCFTNLDPVETSPR